LAIEVKSPMPGKVLRILVKEGDQVKMNDKIVVIESMKMEVDIVSTAGGTVKEIKVQEGNPVKTEEVIAVLE